MVIDHSEAIKELNVERFNRILINNEWRECSETLPVIDPATGLESGYVGNATEADVDDAVNAAREGYIQWRKMSTNKRRGCILKLAGLIQESEKELASLESLSMGMPVQVGKSFAIKACYRNLEYYASWMDKMYGEVVPLTGQSEGHFSYTEREPYGVVGVIIPWNTPLLFVGSKVGPALAAGNSVVLKPSELASWTSLRVAELVEAAGFPPGVINVVTGGSRVGKALCEHQGVDKLTFTGGGETAKHVLAASAANLKPVALELGGKSPNIIMKDANLDKAAMGTALGCFALTGQACAAGSRVYVHEDIYGEMLERLKNVSKILAVGDPLNKNMIIGPLAGSGQFDRVMSFIDEGKSGAELVTGGESLGSSGYFVQPTIFKGADPSSSMAKDEIFGPVMNVWPFKKLEEVVGWANNTHYGLAAGIWTKDINKAHYAARTLEAGFVWVNTWGTIPSAAPFGGYKQSGFGREGGRNVLEEFTQVKSIYMDLA